MSLNFEKLYEDIATFGHIATSYAYPVTVDGRPLGRPFHIRRSSAGPRAAAISA